MIDDNQLIAPKPDVDYRNLSEQPSPEDFFLLSRVTGVVSVKQLCKTSGMGREKTLAALERLMDVGLLEAVDESGNPIAAPSGGTSTPATAEPSAAPAEQATPSASAEPATPEPSRAATQPTGRRESSVAGTSDEDVVPLGTEPSSSPDSGSGRRAFEQGAPISEVRDEELFAAKASSQGAVLDDDDDDLFMPSSPAHISRVEGRKPVQREHQATPVPDQALRQSRPQRRTNSTEEGRPGPEKSPPAAAKSVDDGEASKPKEGDGKYAMFPEDFGSFDVDPAVLVDGVDPELQREIHYVHSQLDQINFYQLFGVASDAERRTIKRSYFKMSKRFHPDKFFRDESGGLAERVEEIFKFVTKAYNTLSKKKKRAEYDQTLAQRAAEADREVEEEGRKREMAAELLARRAEQLEEQGDLVSAAAELRKVASLKRDPEILLRAATLLLRANQKLDEAASFARAAGKQMSDRAQPHLVLGQIYEKNEMMDEALAEFERAQQLDPDDPSIQIHLERIRSQSG